MGNEGGGEHLEGGKEGEEDKEGEEELIDRDKGKIDILSGDGTDLPWLFAIKGSHPTQLLLEIAMESFGGFGGDNGEMGLAREMAAGEDEEGGMAIVAGADLLAAALLFDEVVEEGVIKKSLAVNGKGSATAIHDAHGGHGAAFDSEGVGIPGSDDAGEDGIGVKDADIAGGAAVAGIAVDACDKIADGGGFEDGIAIDDDDIFGGGERVAKMAEAGFHGVSLAAMGTEDDVGGKGEIVVFI